MFFYIDFREYYIFVYYMARTLKRGKRKRKTLKKGRNLRKIRKSLRKGGEDIDCSTILDPIDRDLCYNRQSEKRQAEISSYTPPH